MTKITSINSSEGIFLPCFDSNLFNLEELKIVDSKGNGLISQNWDSVNIASDCDEFNVYWSGELRLIDYNAIRFFITFGEHLELSGTAIVNGKKVTLFSSIKGEQAPIEPTGIVNENCEANGVLITEIILTFRCTKIWKEKNNVTLYWAGAVNFEREKLMEKELKKYSEGSWQDFINLEGKAGYFNNVLLSEEQIRVIKERIKNTLFYNIAEKFKAEALKWEDFNPEAEIREYVPVAEHMYRFARVRDRNRQPLENIIETMAIAGFIFDEPKWTRVAARMILSIAHTPNWFEGPVCCMEGSTFHHVCFMEDHYSRSIITAMGFMGNIFTEKGLKVITDSLEKAWHTINLKSEEKGYRWFMNQGIVGNVGRLMSSAYLCESGRREFSDYVEKSYEDHCTVINNCINSEGHYTEGPQYYRYSFGSSIPLWMVYSKFKGLSIYDVVPDRFRKSVDYIETMMSSNSSTGDCVMVNSGSVLPLSTLILAFMYKVCDWKKAAYYLQQRIDIGGENELFSGLDVLCLALFIPQYDELNKYKCEDGNRLKLFLESGLLAYDFSSSLKGKLLFLGERNPMTGHYHKDRGSIVVEVDGKTILPDLGTTSYSNIVSGLMCEANYHNLAFPEGLQMNVVHPIAAISAAEAGTGCKTEVDMEIMKMPQPYFEDVTKTETGVRAVMNLKPVYNDEVVSAVRDLNFDCSEDCIKINLIDKWQFKNKRKLNVVFNSYSTWILDENSAITIIDDLNIEISFSEKNDIKLNLSQQDIMVDSKLRKVYTLKVSTDEGELIDIASKIIISKLDSKMNIL